MDYLRKKIGIVGGGQLGKMMILEAKRLGLYTVVLDPVADCSAASICDELIVADLNKDEGYIELAGKVDVITYEWENINANALLELEEQGHKVYPSAKALKVIQNKYDQNTALLEAGIPVPRFAAVKTEDDIREYGKKDRYGYPLILKTTGGGYDGKGVALIRDEDSVGEAFASLGGGVKDLMVEEFVDFDKEISVIVCQTVGGDRAVYPIAENLHTNSILDTTIVPARIKGIVDAQALRIADKIAEVFGCVGTFCVELFVTKSGNVLVNEIAPRPHNSGHYTIEGCFANQFENHVRAVIGLPLGNVDLRQPTVMVNLLGGSDCPAFLNGLNEAYGDTNICVHVHSYGKASSKAGRKMGHYTVLDKTIDGALDKADKLKKTLYFN